ncbi:5'/3'-nucleotidase sure [Microdochium bolleyi]|uniref:5'/3'-nucleotidase sure n=1 Tax=Microdochium bolleyi TaxID=196109 RepID=A0A136IXN5_9PEZI|nr:5'/3'-nucleotidase sure [Microdochium bolleyi]
MHILVTNDDGPPSVNTSPFVHQLIRDLQAAGHVVSVCLPHSQRSWIGKAHIIGQTVKPTYYRPSEHFDVTLDPDTSKPQGSTHTRPSQGGEEEWVLVDGTPASAAQIGIHHLFKHRGPIDLVVSGPNYGRNSTSVFALSSGTLGGALEAAACRKKSIAVSYAFFSRKHDPKIINAASKHSVQVIEALYKAWPSDNSVDVYTVNVPLVEGVGKKAIFTNMLQNYWDDADGGCFDVVEGSVGDEEEEEERIREREQGASKAPSTADETSPKTSAVSHQHFKWAPKFSGVYRSVEEAPPGNDGWALTQGFTSVAPLKANFEQAAPHLHGQELKLSSAAVASQDTHPSLSTRTSILALRPKNHFYALIDYGDAYVQPLILDALKKVFPQESFTLLDPPSGPVDENKSELDLASLLPKNAPVHARVLQITQYEAIDWDYVGSHRRTCLVNSYMLRKALIRKHYLSATVENWVAKRPESPLKTHVKRSEPFEVDYAKFLDDALIEAFDLRASMEKNEEILAGNESSSKDLEWWILKPSMSDRGQGIRLFSTMEELQGIFDEWEVDESEGEEEEDDESQGQGDSGGLLGRGDGDNETGINASHLRHFVAQPYIHPPLLLPGDSRKFHIRTYVACVGGLDVYVYRRMLALFAGKPYTPPSSSTSAAVEGQLSSAIDLESHLTNTCLQRSVADNTVQQFWDVSLPQQTKEHILRQICAITGDAFEAAARGMMMHFRPLDNAFEMFGLDFLVDADEHVWLLEVNAFPDFKQTGAELTGLVGGLWENVLRVAMGGFLNSENGQAAIAGESDEDPTVLDRDLILVRKVELGAQFGA